MTAFRVGLKRVVDDSYDIEIGRDLFDSLLTDLQNGLIPGIVKVAIVTDSKVEEKYGRALLERIVEAGFTCHLFSIPSGEGSKTRANKALLEDELLAKGYGRDCCMIALGGGMVSDLTGFVASTFCRGVPYLNYSTTLLSAADASVGGKTAVNTPVATNLIGTFHQPTKVYIDLQTWSTLPIREFRSGLAETIKHACMADNQFFTYLERHMSRILTPDQLVLDAEVCEHMAYRNCQIKYSVVEQDEKETNLRQVLNLGHTAGRAIEALSGYELLHGEAVAIGLAFQAKLARKLGYLTEEERDRVCRLLLSAGFEIEIPSYITPSMLVEKMYSDKKVRSGQIRFVIMSGIGSIQQFEDGAYSVALSEEVLYEALAEC